MPQAQIEKFRELSGFADLALREYEDSLTEIFDAFKRTDIELAGLVVQALESEKNASRFMVNSNHVLGNISPYKALSLGKRGDVLDLIGRIEYGIFS